MTLKDALSFVYDHSKFVQTLWAAYLGLIFAMIGWLITLKATIESGARGTLIIAFLMASAIFAAVLHQNHLRLINMMRIVDAIAPIEARKLDHPVEVYASVFQSGGTPALLHATTFCILPIAAVVSLFICQLTS